MLAVWLRGAVRCSASLSRVQHCAVHCAPGCSAGRCITPWGEAQHSAVRCSSGCSVVQCGTVRCSPGCSAVQCSAPLGAALGSALMLRMQCSTSRCTVLCRTARRSLGCGAVQGWAAQHSPVCSTSSASLLAVQCSVAQRSAPWCAVCCSSGCITVQRSAGQHICSPARVVQCITALGAAQGSALLLGALHMAVQCWAVHRSLGGK